MSHQMQPSICCLQCWWFCGEIFWRGLPALRHHCASKSEGFALLDSYSIWKENYTTSTAMFPSGVRSVNLCDCVGAGLWHAAANRASLCGIHHTWKPVVACQRCLPPGRGMGGAAHQSVTGATLPRFFQFLFDSCDHNLAQFLTFTL